MKGSEIIEKIGMDKAHCVISREMVTIDPEIDYLIIRGTEDYPKIISPENEEAIKAGRHPRLIIEGRVVVSDIEWTTGHHTFEGDVEPKHSPKRSKGYMIK